MILNGTKVEITDEKTGLVLKKTTTSEGEFLNHKIAVNNFLFKCEQQRLTNDKPLLNNPFQINHIRYINKKLRWDFESIQSSRHHASIQKRFYFAFQQRSINQWKSLTFSEAEVDFQTLAFMGLTYVPYPIPLNASLEEWLPRRENAISQLHKSQILVPIICSEHKRDTFEDIFNYEFENSKLIGVQCYGLNNANTITNLIKIKLRNMKLQTGDEAPLLLGLSYSKVLPKSFSCVSGSFAYACYGFDILSERQVFLENMPTDVAKKILSKKVEEIMKYDKTLGGFNLSAEQEFYDGINITREFLEEVKLSEGLTQYQAIQWANHLGQQEDFNILNNRLLESAYEEDSALNYIESEKERWSVFWKTNMPKMGGL